MLVFLKLPIFLKAYSDFLKFCICNVWIRGVGVLLWKILLGIRQLLSNSLFDYYYSKNILYSIWVTLVGQKIHYSHTPNLYYGKQHSNWLIINVYFVKIKINELYLLTNSKVPDSFSTSSRYNSDPSKSAMKVSNGITIAFLGMLTWIPPKLYVSLICNN